jgi:Ca2+-binding RTX toxin-like protein
MTGSITANGIETFTIDSADGAIAVATALIATQGTSITVSGDNAVDLSQVRAVNMATVDASAMTANFTSEHDGTNASVVAMTVTGPATGALDINTGAGADTVTSNAGNDTIDTNNGNDTVKPGAGTNGITMGAGADTFDGSGFAGVNTVTGGSHADSMTGGTGIDTYVFASGDSVAPSSIVTSGANLAAGDVIYYANGVDVVTNFTTTSATADDIINGPTGGADPTTVIGVAHANLNNAGALDMFASGAWDSVAKTFTLTADGLGADTLFLHTAGGADISDSLATTASTIVLVGVDSDNLLTANLT